MLTIKAIRNELWGIMKRHTCYEKPTASASKEKCLFIFSSRRSKITENTKRTTCQIFYSVKETYKIVSNFKSFRLLYFSHILFRRKFSQSFFLASLQFYYQGFYFYAKNFEEFKRTKLPSNFHSIGVYSSLWNTWCSYKLQVWNHDFFCLYFIEDIIINGKFTFI